jgi:hypothetical protein
MLTLALTLALAAPQAGAAAAAPQPTSGARVLESQQHVRALCDLLTPAERLRVKGDAVQRARAEADQDARRSDALGSRYRAVVPGDRLRFAVYDADERRLTLSERTFLTAARGALQVWTVEEPGLPVTVERAAAERIMAAAAGKTLALAITFNLPEDDDEATCAHRPGSNQWALGIEPVAWEYLDGKEVLARGGEGGDKPMVSAAQGARPRVEVAEPVGAGREVRAAVQARAGELEACYAQALRANPSLDGSLVADVDLGPGGAPTAVRLAVDSVQDDAMGACVKGVVSRVRFPAEGRTAIPIHFTLESPVAASGTGSGR